MNVKDEFMQINIPKKYKLVIAVEQLILIKYKAGITILFDLFFISMTKQFKQIFIFFMYSVHFTIY